jgi:hypothetical protein
MSPEDTYRKLKRSVDYNGACAVYTMACIEHPSTTAAHILAELAEPELRKVGWSMDELIEESILRKSFNESESLYG